MDSYQFKYNPSFLSKEELINSFVVRHHDFEILIKTIKESTGNSNQHLMIIGPRGSGKTTLIRRIAIEISRNSNLSKIWHPIVFGEESYEVCSVSEFWLQSIFFIAEQTKDDKWMQIYDELKEDSDDNRLRERALSYLLDFSDKINKKIILFVENINTILGEQINDKDAWALRHTLQNEQRIMLIGTAPTSFDAIDNSDKPSSKPPIPLNVEKYFISFAKHHTIYSVLYHTLLHCHYQQKLESSPEN